MMPTIPFPQVPNYPGVPPIPRTSQGSPGINIDLAQGNVAVSQPQTNVWGIFTQDGQPLYTPTQGGTLSVSEFGFSRRVNMSDFPVEAGSSTASSFASYNKVYQPGHPFVVFALSGTESERTAFLLALEDASGSTTVYNVQSPDAFYGGYTVTSYSYRRTSTRGAVMLYVEVGLEQVLEVTPSYVNTPVGSPQSPSAVAQVNSGIVQPAPASSSLLSSFASGLVGVP